METPLSGGMTCMLPLWAGLLTPCCDRHSVGMLVARLGKILDCRCKPENGQLPRLYITQIAHGRHALIRTSLVITANWVSSRRRDVNEAKLR